MKKRILSILLVLTMVLSLVPAMGITASADGATVITSQTKEWTTGSYVLNYYVQISGTVTVTGNVTLNIPQDGELQIDGICGSVGEDGTDAIIIKTGASLTITGAGTLSAWGGNGGNDDGNGSGNGGNGITVESNATLLFDGVTLDVTGGDGGKGGVDDETNRGLSGGKGGKGIDIASGASLTLNSGTLNVTGGTGGIGGAGGSRTGVSGDGGVGLYSYGEVTVSGGTLTVYGGNGGAAGEGYGGVSGSNARGVDSFGTSFTVNNGTFNATVHGNVVGFRGLLTVNGGDVNLLSDYEGYGAYERALTVTGGSLNVTGRFDPSNSPLFTMSGGKLKVSGTSTFPSDADKRSITGGLFSMDVTNYVATGYSCVSNADTATSTVYPYIVLPSGNKQLISASAGATGGVTFTVDSSTVTSAALNATVKATATAVDGYTVTLSGTYGEGGTGNTLSIGTDGSFTMPAYPVIVTATYTVPAVCKIGTKEYPTIAAALSDTASSNATAEAAGTATEIVLIADDTENVNIPAERNITLDLNNHILKGDSITSVIINNGTLTIKDSTTEGDTPTATTRYFTDAKCEHGETIGETCTRDKSNCQKNNNTALADDCYETYTTTMPANMTGVLAVVGGCITGGKAENGGGINNSGTLYLKGGNIVGNLVSKGNEYDGGGVYNSGTFEMSSGVILGNASFYCGGGVYNGGTFKMTGGSITGNTARTCGGGVGTHSTFTMSAGTISGNTTKNGMGAGVGVSKGNFTMEGGEISGNSALGEEGYGGGVCVQGATFTMKDGEISGNTANYGGGVDNQGTVNLTGGSVTGNTATTGGGVLHWGADSCTLGGTVQIVGNTANGTADNMTLFMTSVAIGTKTGVSEGNGVAVPVAKDPQDASKAYMNVGITMLDEDFKLTSGAFTTNGASTDTKYFFSDVPAYSVKFITDHLELAEKTVCRIGNTEYKSIDAALKHGGADASAVPDGETETNPTTITLIADNTENVTIPAERNITLDLNGYVLKGAGSGSVIANNGMLTITDSTMETTHTTGTTRYFTDNKCAHGIAIGEGCTVADTACAVNDNKAVKDGSFETLYTGEGTPTGTEGTDYVKVTGGCITGGTGTYVGSFYHGGGIYNTGTLTINGGNVVGNKTQKYGGGIYNTGNLTINGSNIVGNGAIDFGGGVYNGNSGAFTAKNTTISYNAAKSGGGVYNDKNSSFIAINTTISGNTGKGLVGGVYADGTVTVGGSTKIIDNIREIVDGTVPDNLRLYPAAKMTIGEGENINSCPVPENDMEIGVHRYFKGSYIPGAFTSNGATTDVKYFTSDSLAYKVKFNNNGTESVTTDDYLELVNYDINAVDSNTASVTLEKNDMTKAQAIAIAKAQKSYTKLSKDTVIAYAKDTDFATNGKFSVITANSTTEWATGTAMTLAEMKADSTKDYFVIGAVSNHTHSWTYALSKTTSDNDTVTATCSTGCDYTGTDTTLTIVKPGATAYTGNDIEATFAGSPSTFCGGTLPTITYEYKTSASGSYAAAADKKSVGYYKASFAVGEGSGAKTAYVEYTITPIICEMGGKLYPSVQAAVTAAGTTTSTIKMLANSTENIEIASGQTITLDLNGYCLVKGSASGSVITNYGKLTVTDNSTDKYNYFKVGSDGLWTRLAYNPGTKNYTLDSQNGLRTAAGAACTDIPAANSIIKVTGGCITGGTGTKVQTKNYTYYYGGGIFNKGSLIINKGNIIGNKSKYNNMGCGAGVYIYEKASCTMNGGVIAGNLADMYGAGIYIHYGTLTMDGGIIQNNTSEISGSGINNDGGTFTMNDGSIQSNTAIYYGGGVLNASGSTMTMVGGSIINNKIKTCIYSYGGAGIEQKGTLIVGGDAVIKDNKSRDRQDNVWCENNSLITVSTDNPLKSGAEIGVNKGNYYGSDDCGQFTANGTKADTKYFFGDNSAYYVKFVDAAAGVSAHLELVNHDLSAVVADTISATLENDSMTLEQAKAIAKAQKPNTGLSKATVIAYAKDENFATNGKYLTIKADTTNDWAADTAMTLADLKAALSGESSKDVFVIGSVTNHTHSWTYAVDTTDSTGATLKATCANTDSGHNGSTTETITIVAPTSSTYDGTAKAASIKDSKTSLGGLTTLPNIQYQKKTGESTYDTATTTAPTAAGTYKASITVDTDKTAYAEYTIAPKQLTISGTTVANKTYDGNTTASATAGALSGVASGDTGNVTVSIQSADFADKKAGTGKTVTVKYSISGTAAANYLAPVDDSSFTATISQKPLVISTESGKSTTVLGKTYDGTTTVSATIGTVVGIVSGDSVTVSVDSAAFDTKDVGTGKSVAVAYKISGTDAGNYEKPVDDTQTASITAKPIHVTADNKSSYVGSDLATLTYTVNTTTPLVSGEALNGALATNADKDVVGSAYQITQGTLTDANNPNYSITFTAGIYTVKALETQTLSFPDGDQTKTYGDGAFTKTVSGASTTVTYESSDPTVATVNSATGEVTILKTGTTTVTAKATASATYAAAEASYTLTVNNASQNAPSAGKTDETVKGKADGKLIGVDNTMEYRKAADSTYTAITGTEVTGLAAGEYKVRYAAKTNYDASPDQTLTIAEGSTFTLTFDAKGGTAVEPIANISWQETVTVPETAKTGYSFKEWNTEETGTGSKLTAAATIEASDTYYAIWQANSYTVTFHANNGTGTMEPQSFTYDVQQSLTANTFTRSGFNLIGWAGTAGAKYAEYPDGASVRNLTAAANGNVDLYAVWTAKPVYSVSGRVQQEKTPAPENVPNALVELKQGQDVIASTHTDSNGDYAFTGIESGEYNIVVTGHASGTQDKTKTTLIQLEGENKTGVNVLLPQGNVSSVVEVKDNTPQIIAGGLDEEAVKQAGSNLSDTIRLVLTVEAVEDITSTPGAPAAEAAAQTAIKQEASGKTVDFIDMDVTKYVNAADSTVHETDTVLEIIVPYPTAGRTDITVYRFHDADSDGNLDAGQQIAMTKLNDRPTAPYTDNTYYVGDGFIAIYTKFFSAYAIGYRTASLGVIDGGNVIPAKSNGTCPQDETCVYAKFTDSNPKAWYHPGVHFCVENGYMVGISAKLFAPSDTLSRAMIVTMLWRMEGSPAADYAMSFKDVADGLWYTEAIRWAQSTGVVKGYDEHSFGPNDNVTREQLAAILMRYAAFKGIDVSERADIGKFTDAESISDWALENVKWANAVGMILGRTETTIVPTGNATRAEAANMVQRFCETVLR